MVVERRHARGARPLRAGTFGDRRILPGTPLLVCSGRRGRGIETHRSHRGYRRAIVTGGGNKAAWFAQVHGLLLGPPSVVRLGLGEVSRIGPSGARWRWRRMVRQARVASAGVRCAPGTGPRRRRRHARSGSVTPLMLQCPPPRARIRSAWRGSEGQRGQSGRSRARVRRSFVPSLALDANRRQRRCGELGLAGVGIGAEVDDPARAFLPSRPCRVSAVPRR